MENEVCENCGRAIGKLEQAFIHKGHVVCRECNIKLRDEAREIQSSPSRAERAPARPSVQKRKLTKSRIFLVALVGWTVFLLVVFLSIMAFYRNEIATRTHEERFDVLYSRFDPDTAAAAIWFCFLAVIWFIGALPLFIAAIVTRKDKKLSRLNT